MNTVRRATLIWFAALTLLAVGVPQAASARTITLRPTADTWVGKERPAVRHGQESVLRTSGSSASRAISYVRFTVPPVSGRVQSARLRLMVLDPTAGRVQVRSTGTASWTERMRWSERAVPGSLVATGRAASRGRWITLNVTSAVSGAGSPSWAVLTSSLDAAGFASRESAAAPQLVIVTANSTLDEDDGEDGDDDSGEDGDEQTDPGSQEPARDVTAPTVVPNPRATMFDSTSAVVEWDAASDNVGVTAYLVSTVGSGAPALVSDAQSRSQLMANLPPNTQVSFVIRARDAAGNVSEPAIASVRTPAVTPPPAPDTTAPSTPSSITATANSHTSITVAWSAATDNVGVTHYLLYRNGSGTALATITSPTLTYTDTTAAPSTVYTYTVRARDAAGNLGTATTAASATTPAAPAAPDTTAPTVPGAVTATASGTTGVTLTWSASTDAVGVTQYVVRRDGAQVATVSAPTTTWSESGLDQDRDYAYTVSARDAAANESAQSAGAVVRTYNPPGANLPIRYDLASITGTKYFVATDGSDSAAGTSVAAPLRTLGAAMAKVGSGQSATIIVRGGTYRTDANRNGFGKTLHIMAYPGEIPTFNGAMQINGGWTTEGSLAWHSYTAQPVTDGHGITFTTGQNLTGDFIGRNPDQAWIGSTQLRQVSAKASVVNGTFWVDSSSSPNRIYFTAVDAAKANLEASNLDWFLDLGGASSSIEGIRITRYSNSANDYGVLRVTYGASNALVRNTEITDSAFNAVTMSGNLSGSGTALVHPVIRDVTVSDSNWMGIGVVFADDTVIDHVRITRSNMFDEFTYSPQSGAIKTSRLRRMDITGSDILDNHSHGIWFDQSNIDMDVVGNRIIDTRGNGVFFEISDDMLLADNYIRNYPGAAAAVKIAGSSGVKMVNNTIVGGNDTVGIYTDSRSMPGCATPGQPLCAGSYSSERDAYRPLPPTLDWMPRIDLMLDNIITDPTGQSYCGRPTAVCVTTSNATASAPIETIFHQAEPARGIPKTVVDGNVYSNSTNGTSLLVPGGANITSLAAWVSKLAAAPINLPGMEAAGRSGASWVNADGTPTAALAAVHGQAAAVPVNDAVNEYIPAGTRHYGAITTGP